MKSYRGSHPENVCLNDKDPGLTSGCSPLGHSRAHYSTCTLSQMWMSHSYCGELEIGKDHCITLVYKTSGIIGSTC